MEHDASFGWWLTLRRQALRLQRAELAARIGCATVTLRKIEADERGPSRQIAERLADQFAIPPHEREIFNRRRWSQPSYPCWPPEWLPGVPGSLPSVPPALLRGMGSAPWRWWRANMDSRNGPIHPAIGSFRESML